MATQIAHILVILSNSCGTFLHLLWPSNLLHNYTRNYIDDARRFDQMHHRIQVWSDEAVKFMEFYILKSTVLWSNKLNSWLSVTRVSSIFQRMQTRPFHYSWPSLEKFDKIIINYCILSIYWLSSTRSQCWLIL